jgi:hypothetical protein
MFGFDIYLRGFTRWQAVYYATSQYFRRVELIAMDSLSVNISIVTLLWNKLQYCRLREYSDQRAHGWTY